MNMHTYLAIGLATVLAGAIAGCGPADDGRPKTDAEKRQALDESAFGDMAGTMDRAREVEQLNIERKDRLDAELDN